MLKASFSTIAIVSLFLINCSDLLKDDPAMGEIIVNNKTGQAIVAYIVTDCQEVVGSHSKISFRDSSIVPNGESKSFMIPLDKAYYVFAELTSHTNYYYMSVWNKFTTESSINADLSFSNFNELKQGFYLSCPKTWQSN